MSDKAAKAAAHHAAHNPDNWVGDKGFNTRAIHAGQPPNKETGAVMVPITLSTTFAQYSPGEMYPSGHEYTRGGNPTRDALEACVASLEKAKYGLAFSSGLGATSSVLQTLPKGCSVLCSDDVYGGTNRYLNKVGKAVMDVNTTMCDMTDLAKVKAALAADANIKCVWLESPSNPTLKVVDIAAVAALAHERPDVLVVADNTFATPYFQNPLTLGADIVLHSATKYLNGHSDVLMGFLLTSSDELHQKVRFQQFAVGAVPSPFDAYLVMRSLKTLGLRMEAHAANAMAVAQALEKSDKVDKVFYPGLPSHPQHAVAKKQMSGFSGMVTFVLKGGEKAARTFLESIMVFTLAESLGGVESLAEHPAIMTHASVPAEQRAVLGISDGLVRLSVGVESSADLVGDIEQALAKC